MTKQERDECERLADRLNAAFDWKDTPQGYEYWQTVYRNLLGLWSPPRTQDTV